MMFFKCLRLSCCLLAVLVLSSACGLIYKQNIQQGNALEQKDLDELYLGMNKRQVSFVLGSPAIHDPFNQQRWDYVQTYSRRGRKMSERIVTLRFKNDLLVEMTGVKRKSSKAAAAGPGGTPPAATTKAAKKAKPAASGVTKKPQQEPEIKALKEHKAQDRDLKQDQQSAPSNKNPPDSGG